MAVVTAREAEDRLIEKIAHPTVKDLAACTAEECGRRAATA